MQDSGHNRAGFFDIDGTIFRSSLLIELLNGLVRAGVFSQDAEREMERDYIAWLYREGSYDSYLENVMRIYDREIVGKNEEDIKGVVSEVLAAEKGKVYRFTRDLVHSIKDGGGILVAISGSPDFIVKPFAEYIGFDVCYGGVFEVKNGRFTGLVIDGDTWKDKSRVVNRFMKSDGAHIDLSRSVAVGDSGADIPMLEAVGNPIAFNPDHVLAKHAQKNKWRIVVERKNVVYEISKCVISGY